MNNGFPSAGGKKMDVCNTCTMQSSELWSWLHVVLDFNDYEGYRSLVVVCLVGMLPSFWFNVELFHLEVWMSCHLLKTKGLLRKVTWKFAHQQLRYWMKWLQQQKKKSYSDRKTIATRLSTDSMPFPWSTLESFSSLSIFSVQVREVAWNMPPNECCSMSIGWVKRQMFS